MILTGSEHENSNSQTGGSECFDEETTVSLSLKITLPNSPLGPVCSLTKRNTHGERAWCKSVKESSGDDTTQHLTKRYH